MKHILIRPDRAGDGKSTRSMQEIMAAFHEADRNPGKMQIRRCGYGWACCNGDCGNCLVPRMTTSNRTEPNHEQTYSASTTLKED